MAFKFSGDSIYLSPAPLYHAAPLRWCAAVHRLGGTVVVMEKFDPEAALAAIKSNPPHLVIMDVVMPGQNGFQATREITRDPATRSLPVIICTSKNQETDRIWGIRQGARDFMVKPVDQALLLQKIATILSNVSA
jgi:DNA-binding response OmpR family regulator